MIAGEPWAGAAEHWKAIGTLASKAKEAAMQNVDPKDARIAELSKQVSDLTDKLRFSEQAKANRDDVNSKLQINLDDQASQIADLQGKVGLGMTNVDCARSLETIKRMTAIEETLRRDGERLEARVAQLLNHMASRGVDPPDEMAYYRNQTGS